VTTVRPTPSVVRAGPADLEALSDLIATAFHDLAPSRWLIADPAARRRILPGYFRLLIAYAMVTGLVLISLRGTPCRRENGARVARRRRCFLWDFEPVG
jgi:hypothetical protein